MAGDGETADEGDQADGEQAAPPPAPPTIDSTKVREAVLALEGTVIEDF